MLFIKKIWHSTNLVPNPKPWFARIGLVLTLKYVEFFIHYHLLLSESYLTSDRIPNGSVSITCSVSIIYRVSTSIFLYIYIIFFYVFYFIHYLLIF